jgi:hypothetical protein
LVGGVGSWWVDGGPQEVAQGGGATVATQGGGLVVGGTDNDVRRLAVGLAKEELGYVALGRGFIS